MKGDSKLSQALLLILIFPILILTVLFLLLYTPIDFIRYCFSSRRKEMKRLYGRQAKYTFLITLTDHYRTFELISKNKLPIMFIRKNENPCEYGYFYYNNTLFLTDAVPHFDSENNHWYIAQGHYGADLLTYTEMQKEDFQKCTGFNESARCERVIFLVNEKYVSGKDKARIQDADFILMYNKKNFKSLIRKFLEK